VTFKIIICGFSSDTFLYSCAVVDTILTDIASAIAEPFVRNANIGSWYNTKGLEFVKLVLEFQQLMSYRDVQTKGSN